MPLRKRAVRRVSSRFDIERGKSSAHVLHFMLYHEFLSICLLLSIRYIIEAGTIISKNLVVFNMEYYNGRKYFDENNLVRIIKVLQTYPTAFHLQSHCCTLSVDLLLNKFDKCPVATTWIQLV